MAQPRILVVDAHVDTPAVAVERLRYYGAVVWTASDGIECRDRVAEEVPDLDLVDLSMLRTGGLPCWTVC